MNCSTVVQLKHYMGNVKVMESIGNLSVFLGVTTGIQELLVFQCVCMCGDKMIPMLSVRLF